MLGSLLFVNAMGVVVLVLFRVQTPVQHLLLTVRQQILPTASSLKQISTSGSVYTHSVVFILLFLPHFGISWRAGLGGALTQQLLSCG